MFTWRKIDFPQESVIRGDLGKAKIVPSSPVIAGSFDTWKIIYTAGDLGIDDQGSIKVSMRFATDCGSPQFDNPRADNYVSLRVKGKAKISARYSDNGNIRPWYKTIKVDVYDGFLRPGDTIGIVFGDKAGGSRGFRMQTFCEKTFEFRIFVDPLGTELHVPLPNSPKIEIIPGEIKKLVAVTASEIDCGKNIAVKIKGEDIWGNPLRKLKLLPQITLVNAEDNTTQRLDLVSQKKSAGVTTFKLASVLEEGFFFLRIKDKNRGLACESNPFQVARSFSRRHFWGDLHGQSEETIGTNPVDDYFHFARHFAFLDFVGHQGNDFQITEAKWRKFKEAVKKHRRSGKFEILHGYEWSGNTPIGGDHNIYFLEDAPPLYRSSGWLSGNLKGEAYPLTKLYRHLKKHKAISIPHVGGRFADLAYHDRKLEPAIEIYSAWGKFEWLIKEAFKKQMEIGFVAGSDDHMGRPGASYPGAKTWGTYGGLTAVVTEDLSRKGLWQAIKRRNSYATTGQRIWLEVMAGNHPAGEEFTTKDDITINGIVVGTSAIEAIEVFRATKRIRSQNMFSQFRKKDGDYIKITFAGSRLPGRERRVNWKGKISLSKAKIKSVKLAGIYNPEQGIKKKTKKSIDFEFITTGNRCALLLTLDRYCGVLNIETALFHKKIKVESIGFGEKTIYSKYLDIESSLRRIPGKYSCRMSRFSFTDGRPIVGKKVPYYVRVRQIDEATIWSSPFYITKEGDSKR